MKGASRLTQAMRRNTLRYCALRGLTHGRPVASLWVHALEHLKDNLRRCTQEPAHYYYGPLQACPWCVLETRSGIIFFIGNLTFSGTTFDVTRVWARIVSVASPGPPSTTVPAHFTVSPIPLPIEVMKQRAKAVAGKILSVAVIVFGLLYLPYLWFLVVGAAWFIYAASAADYSALRAQRTQALRDAESQFRSTEKRYQAEGGERAFLNKRNELLALKQKHEQLRPNYEKEIQNLRNTVRNKQLEHFLERFFIDAHYIPQIGQGRKATLASFGIETAAHVKKHKIVRLKGFGSALAEELMIWRRSIEAKFVFDPQKGVDPNDIKLIEHRYALERKRIETSLSSGPAQLDQIRKDTLRKREVLRPELEQAARLVSQATADLTVVP